MVRKILAVVGVIILAFAGWIYAITQGWLGDLWDAGEVAAGPRPAAVNVMHDSEAAAVAFQHDNLPDQQILFGDLHVHSTFSVDAFAGSLPMVQGEGAHPVSDACDFARYCSALDFWSINDHAEALTPQRWQETISSIRACNAVSPDQNNPDTVAFLGWEWTQMGDRPDNHYGHRNIILASTDDDQIPTRPIAAKAPSSLPDDFGLLGLGARMGLTLASPGSRSLDAGRYYREMEAAMANQCADGIAVRDLPADCIESAMTPDDLTAKLQDWGHPLLLIPHGTTWGNYTPPGSDWRKQLTRTAHDPAIQTMVEIYSGHGSAEEYRDWRAATFDADGNATCPEPSEAYVPSCWRAGELIKARCLDEGFDETTCNNRATATRWAHVQRGMAGHLVVAGAKVIDWLDAGQCTDCFLPAFNYRPLGSAQYMLAISKAMNDGTTLRFKFGFIGSSDNHTARPGTGYKEYDRREMTEATGLRKGFGTMESRSTPAAEPNLVDLANLNVAARAETARISSFFTTGGLIAVHAQGKSRQAIWSSLQDKQVYGTSGDRIMLWFDLMNDPSGEIKPMGSETIMTVAPQFHIKALGAFKQNPGCPQTSIDALGPDRLYDLCRNECYNPSEERKRITRLEVVKITPQQHDDEPIAPLITDPWKVIACDADQAGCEAQFTDPDYTIDGRDAVYYVRAIQEPSNAINGANLRCTYDAEGTCVAVNPCNADEDATDYQDDCLAPVEERAWSSPIFVDFENRIDG